LKVACEVIAMQPIWALWWQEAGAEEAVRARQLATGYIDGVVLLLSLSLTFVCACAQMKFGANDTGRIFNWHPVRATVCFL